MPKFTIITVKKHVSSCEVEAESIQEAQRELDFGNYEDEIEEQHNEYSEISDTDSYIKGNDTGKTACAYIFGSDAIEEADRYGYNFDEIKKAIEADGIEGEAKEITFGSIEEMMAYEQGLADGNGWLKYRKEYQANVPTNHDSR